MVWRPEILEFVLNQLVHLVLSGVCFNLGFKEEQIEKVSADVFAFAGIHVSTLQIYNHMRRWMTKWSVIIKMKSDCTQDWSEDDCCLYAADEETAHEYIKVVSFIEFLHRSESMSLSSALTLIFFGLQCKAEGELIKLDW
jgi:hypothetical protein